MMATPGDSAAGKEEKPRVVLIAMDGSKHSDHAFQCKYCYKMLLIDVAVRKGKRSVA